MLTQHMDLNPLPRDQKRVQESVPFEEKTRNDDFMYYDKDGQYIDKDLEESQLF